MRSIHEWKADRAVSEGFGGDLSHADPSPVDHEMEAELRPKVRHILDAYRTVPRGELLDKMRAVISQTVRDSESRGPSATVNSGLDARLRDELGPKVERILDMDTYKSEPREEVERKIISTVYRLVASLSGGSQDKINDDPIAKECASVPSFMRWIEENEADGSSALSEPQHKAGEVNMDLKSVVEKRMMQMAMDLESDGKGSRQEILAAMKAVVDAAGKGQQPAAGAQQPNAQQQGEPQQAVPQV